MTSGLMKHLGIDMDRSADQERLVLDVVEQALGLSRDRQVEFVNAQSLDAEFKERALGLLAAAATGGQWLTDAGGRVVGRWHPIFCDGACGWRAY